MSLYVGSKLIKPVAMTLGDYNNVQGWTIPKDQDPDTEGYLVEYLDGGKSNHPDYAGYISWSPKEVFDNAYKGSGNLSFGDAVLLAKRGYKVARSGWNGAGMFAYIVPAATYPAQTTMIEGVFEDDMVPYREYWALKTAQNDVAVWAPSGSDSLAEDWCIVDSVVSAIPKKDTTFAGRLREEYSEINAKIYKLKVFIGTPAFGKIHIEQQEHLKEQIVAMVTYSGILRDRLVNLSALRE